MSIPNPGTYQAALTGQIVIYNPDSGATCAAVPLKLTSGETPWSGKSTQTLVKSDGTVNEKTLKLMRDVFGDPSDPANRIYRFAEDAETPIAEIQQASSIVFEVVMEHKQDQDRESGEMYTYASVKWLNPVGGNVKMPAPISRKDFLAKHGGKLRAFGLGTAKPKPVVAEATQEATPAPAQPAAPEPAKKKAPVKPAAPPAPAKTAANQPPTATQEEAWERLLALRPDIAEDQAALGEIWYAAQQQVANRQDNTLTIQQWGAVKAKFEAEFAK